MRRNIQPSPAQLASVASCMVPIMRTTWHALRGGAVRVGLLALLVLGGCASSPPGSGVSVPSSAGLRPALPADRDGPQANPPPDLAGVPDAEPRLETIRTGGPNKPYVALGQAFVPITKDAPFTERGLASWYGRKFHGLRTASGEVYDMYAMTAAHPTLPIPSYARVRNPKNGAEVVVRINDRGPFHSGRIVDLSYTAALKLGVLRGVAPVELERITYDDIRTGAWRRGAPTLAAAPPAPPARADVEPPAAAQLAVTAPSASFRAQLAAAPEGARPPVQAVVDAAVAPPAAMPASGYWVQLGAFRQQDGAETFRRRVASEADWLMPLLAVFTDASVYRLQAGPYASRDEARSVAERVREALQLVPVIVDRR